MCRAPIISLDSTRGSWFQMRVILLFFPLVPHMSCCVLLLLEAWLDFYTLAHDVADYVSHLAWLLLPKTK